jgi:hypothetical protein
LGISFFSLPPNKQIENERTIKSIKNVLW